MDGEGPIRFRGDGPNLDVYATSDPVNVRDPTGKQSIIDHWEATGKAYGRNQEKRDKMHDMQAAVKVRVVHGQLVVDEPATLPEGSRWKLVPLDSLEEEMGPEEHAEFLRELEISAKEADSGELIDAEDVLAKLRAPA